MYMIMSKAMIYEIKIIKYVLSNKGRGIVRNRGLCLHIIADE